MMLGFFCLNFPNVPADADAVEETAGFDLRAVVRYLVVEHTRG
jgi:hypothetical protein